MAKDHPASIKAAFVKIAEAARILGISRNLVNNHIETGEIEAINIGLGTVRRHLRVSVRSIEQFHERRAAK